MTAASRLPASASVEQLETRRLLSTVVALFAGRQLAYFDSDDPARILARTNVKGLARGESLVGVDFRPSDGQLYGVGDTGRLYTIEPAKGRATAVGSGIGEGLGIVSADDADYGVDFNPAADLLRIVNDAELNLRVNPTTGAAVDGDAAPGVQGDLALAYATGDAAFGAQPSVVASAYTRNVAGAPNTTLYGIDASRDILVLQGSQNGAPTSPNTGQLTTVGALGVDTTDAAGFDIETVGNTDTALASLSTNARGRSGLYSINLTTGAATAVGEIRAGRRPVTDIAIAPTERTVLVARRGNQLHTFDTALPHVLTSRIRVTGLQRGEQVVAIDLRPSNGTVYAATSHDRVYTIAPTGQATLVSGSAPQADVDLRRGDYAFDFNPVADAIRVVNEHGQNLRVNPDTGTIVDADPAIEGVQTDGDLVYAANDANSGRDPHVVGAAYTNNTAGSTTTILYDIDTNLDVLATQGTANGSVSPNAGQLFTVGPLGGNASDVVGFDIVTEGPTNTAYAAMKVRNQPGLGLYTIDLATGAATLVGRIGTSNIPLVGMTVVA